jgi:Lrp/AsnC family transcriptional regulator for asnA, asnC and gidA
MIVRMTNAPRPTNHRPVQLDDVSKAIIEQLQADGRRSYADIGKAVGLSEAAVRQRVSCRSSR